VSVLGGFAERRLSIAADLSSCSLRSAVEEYIEHFNDSPEVLVCNSYDYVAAHKLAVESGRALIVVGVPILLKWSWFVAGNKGVVYSPGA
jgi:hypothetical protein